MFALLDRVSDIIVDHERSVRQMFPRGILSFVFLDKMVVFVHPHTVCVGKNVGLAAVAARVLPYVHGRTQFQNRMLLLLAFIDPRRQLRIAEHIHHAVVTDAVSAAEILVCVVVKHTPAEASRNVALRCRSVEHPHMPQRVFHAVFLPVERLGRIHMSVVLADQIRLFRIGSHRRLFLTSPVCSVMHKIIVSVDILQKTALFVRPHTACRSGGIKFVRRRVCPAVKIIIVLRLIDAHAPENDRRVVAVLHHHIAHIYNRLVLPRLITDVLPSRNLHKYQKSDSVTLVDKVMGLRIVGCPHGVDAKLIL